MIPLNTRQSSTRGFPWLFGKYGSGCAICTSESQNKSLKLRLIRGRLNIVATSNQWGLSLGTPAIPTPIPGIIFR